MNNPDESSGAYPANKTMPQAGFHPAITKMPPAPPSGYHPATPEELNCLPKGSLYFEDNHSQRWVPSRYEFQTLNTQDPWKYCCPDTPSEASHVQDTHGQQASPPSPSAFNMRVCAFTEIEKVFEKYDITDDAAVYAVIGAVLAIRGMHLRSDL